MIKTSFAVIAGAILVASPFLRADELPVLSEKPFLGRWIGLEQDEFDFSITANYFEGEIFLKQRTREGIKRINESRSIQLRYLMEEKVGDKWQRRLIVTDGFETAQGASAEVEKFEAIVTFEGGTRVKITHELDEDVIRISSEILEAESENPMRSGVEMIIPNLYRSASELDERELKRALKGDEVVILTTQRKKQKYDLDEEVNLETEKTLAEGAFEFSFESKNLAKKTLQMSSQTEKTGKIFFRQRGALYEGFSAIWYPEAAAAGQAASVLVLEID